tara:strand:- start:1615 stop:1755 length:141 start_codon:yes stop_codon:yes gene_type:complete
VILSSKGTSGTSILGCAALAFEPPKDLPDFGTPAWNKLLPPSLAFG